MTETITDEGEVKRLMHEKQYVLVELTKLKKRVKELEDWMVNHQH